jgi:hypothetical protein
LETEDNSSKLNEAVNEFNRRFDAASTALETQQLALTSAVEDVGKQLSIIESERATAGRALNKALWYLSGESGAVAGYSAIKSLSQERYQRAHVNAQKAAFLAKRAIEQRLGVYLSDMAEDLPLVDAPQGWESSVCQTSPVNYEDLKDADGNTIKSFADKFIGDYVTRLENVVESYRLEYNFNEGKDSAVISLRDDVMGARDICAVPSANRLLHSSELFRTAYTPPALGSWGVTGCELTSSEDQECIVVSEALDSSGQPRRPFTATARSQVLGYDITSGSAPEGWQAGAMVGQAVHLEPGTYRFSWYSPNATSIAAQIGGVSLDGVGLQHDGQGTIPADAATWARHYFTFAVDIPADFVVGFRAPSGASTVTVGAPMLELVEPGQSEPGMFVDNGDTMTAYAAVCPDLDGGEFRERWRYGCEKVCVDGYAADCRDHAKSACFWETSFHVSQRAIEAGEQLIASGFARGNFNYRIERIGVNLVGTGLRNCEGSASPETCFGSGFLPYSLYHRGPFYVRNHFGNDFLAPLFDGNIEHGRGLASERYVSNPVSATDKGLLEQYERTEFQGRPIDGTFVLRIWDEPGVNFWALQDVQLVLDYGYWTRND